MPDSVARPPPSGTCVPLFPAAIPATCVPCSDSFGVERELGVLGPRGGRREGAGGDHLGGRVRRLALREAGRHRVAGRVEERMPVVDSVVDDRDLHPLACGREALAPETGRADRGRAPVELRPVDRAAVHGGDAVDLLQPPDRSGRDDDGERVQDDPVAPADLRLPGRRRRSGRQPAPARPGCRVSRLKRRARVEVEPPLASAAAATARRTATGARRRPAPSTAVGNRRADRARRQAQAAPPRARPRGKPHVSDAESYARDVKNFSRSRLYDPVRRKEDRCARLATATAAARTATARTATASTAVSAAAQQEGRGYNCRPRGCGGIGRRARFRSV